MFVAIFILTQPVLALEKTLELPDCPTWFKAWMPHTAITDKTSKQYELQQIAYTDVQGFRRVSDDYMIAVGSFYAEKCGKRFTITLKNGKEFTAVVGDIKADVHTNKNNQFKEVIYGGNFISANVIEFIVDEKIMDKKVLNSGSVCDLGFEGDIEQIKEIP